MLDKNGSLIELLLLLLVVLNCLREYLFSPLSATIPSPLCFSAADIFSFQCQCAKKKETIILNNNNSEKHDDVDGDDDVQGEGEEGSKEHTGTVLISYVCFRCKQHANVLFFLFFSSSRFYAIYYPLSKKCSTALCWTTIFLIWMWSFAISFPWLVYFEVIPVEGVGDYDLADQAETFQVRRERRERR